ncbi:Bet_v_1 domain-containing protein [Psidium guajava]|nr:Bet_v_1 domain-containing protein [Psidium guajava]
MELLRSPRHSLVSAEGKEQRHELMTAATTPTEEEETLTCHSADGEAMQYSPHGWRSRASAASSGRHSPPWSCTDSDHIRASHSASGKPGSSRC